MGIRIPFCDECKQDDPIMFMLKPAIWKQIAKFPREILCLNCAEKRLGRKVTLSDLRPCGVTDQMILGGRIFLQSIKTMEGIQELQQAVGDISCFHQTGDRMVHLPPALMKEPNEKDPQE